jgi:small subunit ribosomal protein S11e
MIILFVSSTCIIRRDYLHYISKYNRFEKRHRNLAAHISPAFRDVAVGDQVTVGQCRPLSKVCVLFICLLLTFSQTVRFNVVRVSKVGGAKKQFTKF